VYWLIDVEAVAIYSSRANYTGTINRGVENDLSMG